MTDVPPTVACVVTVGAVDTARAAPAVLVAASEEAELSVPVPCDVDGVDVTVRSPRRVDSDCAADVVAGVGDA